MSNVVDGCIHHWGYWLATGSNSVADLPDGPCDCLWVTSAAEVAIRMPDSPDDTGCGLRLVNGDFTNARNWVVTNGWSIASGKATHAVAGAPVTTLTQPLVGKVGAKYLVVVVVSGRTAGTVTPAVGTGAGSAINANGTSYHTITAATNGTLTFTPTGDFDGSIESVEVYQYTPALPAGVWVEFAASRVVGLTAGSVFVGYYRAKRSSARVG